MNVYAPFAKKLKKLTKKSEAECTKILEFIGPKPIFGGTNRYLLVGELKSKYSLSEEEALALYNNCVLAITPNHCK